MWIKHLVLWCWGKKACFLSIEREQRRPTYDGWTTKKNGIRLDSPTRRTKIFRIIFLFDWKVFIFRANNKKHSNVIDLECWSILLWFYRRAKKKEYTKIRIFIDQIFQHSFDSIILPLIKACSKTCMEKGTYEWN